MIFRKDYGQLIRASLQNLVSRSKITNQTVGGIARSILEVINLNVSEYYDILDINTMMGFVSTSEGYFLDLIGDLFNIKRNTPEKASVSSSDNCQLFYVSSGVLYDYLPTGKIPNGTVVSTEDGQISFTVTSDTSFGLTSTEVYVPIEASESGANYNVGLNTLVKHSINSSNIFTTNSKVVSGGTDLESDENFRYRIVNATLSSAKANESAIRIAALSVPGVSDVVIKPYARGIGSYDIIVLPVEGLATDKMISDVQNAINTVQAVGITGRAIKPSIVPVDISVKVVFSASTPESHRVTIRSQVKTAIERYIVNIPLGGTFVLNELRQRIMDVSEKITDHIVNCYYFRNEPTFLGNVEIYWDEMFYPNTDSAEAVVVL